MHFVLVNWNERAVFLYFAAFFFKLSSRAGAFSCPLLTIRLRANPQRKLLAQQVLATSDAIVYAKPFFYISGKADPVPDIVAELLWV